MTQLHIISSSYVLYYYILIDLIFYYLIGRALFRLRMQSFYSYNNESDHIIVLQ